MAPKAARQTRAAVPAKSLERLGPLTPQLIAETALAIASEKGVEGISTRKLGDALGYAHTAVYLHFPTRDDLLKAVFDLAISRAPRDIERTDDWEQRARAVCSAIRLTLLDHPVCYELAQRFPARGVGMWAEDMLMIARGAGYSDEDAIEIGVLLSQVSVGLASNSAHRAVQAVGRNPGEQARPEERDLAILYTRTSDVAVFDTVVECVIRGLRDRVPVKERLGPRVTLHR